LVEYNKFIVKVMSIHKSYKVKIIKVLTFAHRAELVQEKFDAKKFEAEHKVKLHHTAVHHEEHHATGAHHEEHHAAAGTHHEEHHASAGARHDEHHMVDKNHAAIPAKTHHSEHPIPHKAGEHPTVAGAHHSEHPIPHKTGKHPTVAGAHHSEHPIPHKAEEHPVPHKTGEHPEPHKAEEHPEPHKAGEHPIPHKIGEHPAVAGAHHSEHPIPHKTDSHHEDPKPVGKHPKPIKAHALEKKLKKDDKKVTAHLHVWAAKQAMFKKKIQAAKAALSSCHTASAIAAAKAKLASLQSTYHAAMAHEEKASAHAIKKDMHAAVKAHMAEHKAKKIVAKPHKMVAKPHKPVPKGAIAQPKGHNSLLSGPVSIPTVNYKTITKSDISSKRTEFLMLIAHASSAAQFSQYMSMYTEFMTTIIKTHSEWNIVQTPAPSYDQIVYCQTHTMSMSQLTEMLSNPGKINSAMVYETTGKVVKPKMNITIEVFHQQCGVYISYMRHAADQATYNEWLGKYQTYWHRVIEDYPSWSHPAVPVFKGLAMTHSQFDQQCKSMIDECQKADNYKDYQTCGNKYQMFIQKVNYFHNNWTAMPLPAYVQKWKDPVGATPEETEHLKFIEGNTPAQTKANFEIESKWWQHRINHARVRSHYDHASKMLQALVQNYNNRGIKVPFPGIYEFQPPQPHQQPQPQP
jgi:hypothetical protein